MTSTSVVEPAAGSRPDTTVIGRLRSWLRSTPSTDSKRGLPSARVAWAAGGNERGGTMSIGVATTGTTDATLGSD